MSVSSIIITSRSYILLGLFTALSSFTRSHSYDRPQFKGRGRTHLPSAARVLQLPDLLGRPSAQRLGLADFRPSTFAQKFRDGLHIDHAKDVSSIRRAKIPIAKK